MPADRDIARQIALAAEAAGGRAYYVGGCVRDALRGVDGEDVDVEVHGVAPDALYAILGTIGEPLAMGESFGIFGLRHCGIDVAMPRREAVTGRGHRDFDVLVDPFLGEENAARRRDFTINAMMQDVLTGEILDFFGGRDDLARGVLRHVSADTFPEDPLRVLRGAQFAARFGFALAPETTALCRTMDLSALSRERVLGELEKALLQADTPSVFFEVLREAGHLSVWFPEVGALIGVPQDPRYHAEGDVWNHTMRVLDAAAAYRADADDPFGFMLAALAHDFGKTICTVQTGGAIHAYGHETRGLPLCEAFLRRLTDHRKRTAYVLELVRYHMQPNILAGCAARPRSMNRLFDRVRDPDALLLLAKADWEGCGARPPYPYGDWLRARLDDYRACMAQPWLGARDLIRAGFEPGETLGEALSFAHKLRLAGLDRDAALAQTCGQFQKTRK